VADPSRGHAEVEVVQRALGQLSGRAAARGDEPVTVGLPAVDGCGPFRSDEAARQVRVPIGGGEVDRATVTALLYCQTSAGIQDPCPLSRQRPAGHRGPGRAGTRPPVTSRPKEFAEFEEAIKPQGLAMFYGALDPRELGTVDRLIRRVPAGRALLPEGDFRDWEAIEAWAESITHELRAPTRET
jgi:hypothetical protein